MTEFNKQEQKAADVVGNQIDLLDVQSKMTFPVASKAGKKSQITKISM